MGKAAGNATKAAELAGYKPANARFQASRLLTKANIKAAVAAKTETLTNAGIADAKERREILTQLARSTETDPTSRIRAIDVANKMDGAYIEKHEHKFDVPTSIAFVITQQPGAENRT